MVQTCLNYLYIIINNKRRKLEWRRAHYSKTNHGPLTRLTLFFCSFVLHLNTNKKATNNANYPASKNAAIIIADRWPRFVQLISQKVDRQFPPGIEHIHTHQIAFHQACYILSVVKYSNSGQLNCIKYKTWKLIHCSLEIQAKLYPYKQHWKVKTGSINRD